MITGHADGVITLDLAESDDAHREALREQLGEPYRTVLGHFRHEIGHYYWPLLVPDGPRARALPRAVRRRARGLRRGARPPLRDGPPADWARALRQRLRDDAPVGGLGRDLRPLPPHPRHAADRAALRRARRGADAAPPTRRRTDFRALIDDWLPLTYALNAINRSMGRDDLYPFVLPRAGGREARLRPRARHGSTAPGLRSPAGSSARLIARIAAQLAAPRTSPSQRALATPTPCSALIVPPSGGEPQDRLVDRVVVGGGAEHVDVDVAVAEVAEEDRAGARRRRAHPAARARRTRPAAPSGTPTSSLCGTPAARSPRCAPRGSATGASRPALSSATTRVVEPGQLQRGRQLLRRVVGAAHSSST